MCEPYIVNKELVVTKIYKEHNSIAEKIIQMDNGLE